MSPSEQDYLNRLQDAYHVCFAGFCTGKLTVSELTSVCEDYRVLPGVVLDMLNELGSGGDE